MKGARNMTNRTWGGWTWAGEGVWGRVSKATIHLLSGKGWEAGWRPKTTAQQFKHQSLSVTCSHGRTHSLIRYRCPHLLYLERHDTGVFWMSGQHVVVTLHTPHLPASEKTREHSEPLALDSSDCLQEHQEWGPRQWQRNRCSSVVFIETWRVSQGWKPECSQSRQTDPTSKMLFMLLATLTDFLIQTLRWLQNATPN